MEPRYVDVYDEFDSGGDYVNRVPKWRQPSTQFQRRVLSICGRKTYHNKMERHRLVMLDKSKMSMLDAPNCEYPIEYIERILLWAEKKNRSQIVITLPVLLNILTDKDRIAEFKRNWSKNAINGFGAEPAVIYDAEDAPWEE